MHAYHKTLMKTNAYEGSCSCARSKLSVPAARVDPSPFVFWACQPVADALELARRRHSDHVPAQSVRIVALIRAAIPIPGDCTDHHRNLTRHVRRHRGMPELETVHLPHYPFWSLRPAVMRREVACSWRRRLAVIVCVICCVIIFFRFSDHSGRRTTTRPASSSWHLLRMACFLFLDFPGPFY